MYDVVIVGAGVIGGMIARKLSAYELRLCIVEKANDVAAGATKANSAIVHAGFDAKEGSLKARLNVRGAQLMSKVTEELGVKYQNNGSLVIGFSEEDRAVIRELYARGSKNGVPGLEILDKAALKKQEPKLSDAVQCALYAPTGGIVCPYELCIAAVGNAMDNGAELKLNFCVEKIEDAGEYYLLSSGEQCVKARYVVNAAGLYADEIAAMVGDTSFRIHPRRGEYILLDKECGGLVSHTIFRTPGKMGKGILVTPTVDGNLLIGPTSVDIEDKEDKAATAEGLAKLLREAGESVSEIPYRKAITSFCGLRAVGDTGDFIIRSPKERFVNIAGIESPGLSASPAIAECAAELLGGIGLELRENKRYTPYRKPMHAFREASLEEKNEMICKSPAYGKVVCRCEGITEGEILDAIRTNPRPADLDGVKRRTRAQMGRCQGGFCSPYITELLARELCIPYERVTKFGGGSYINVGKTKEGGSF